MKLEQIKKTLMNIFDIITGSNMQTTMKIFILYILYGTFVLVPIMTVVGFITVLIKYPYAIIAIFCVPIVYVIVREFKRKARKGESK